MGIIKEGPDQAILCAPCAICKAQLPVVMKHYGIDVKVQGLTDLVVRALVLS
ncbi:hypothetical protein hamaS1_24770 [Moorella sp. Hama-1]|nr:hypothetical protein hamaS1_24770 [Moorella sp. Hama-1]